MAAGIYSFTIEQGSTWDQYLNIVSSDSKPVDLSQYTASMQIRSTNTKSGTLYATVSCSIEPTSGSADDQGDPVSGSVRLLLTAADTEALTYTNGYYDVEIASGSIAGPLVGTSNALYTSITTNPTDQHAYSAGAAFSTTTDGSGENATLNLTFTGTNGSATLSNVTVATAGTGYKCGDTLTVTAATLNAITTGAGTTDLVFKLIEDDIIITADRYVERLLQGTIRLSKEITNIAIC